MKYYRVGFMILSIDDKLIFNNINTQGLSNKVLSISNHVRPTFPDAWFFRWCKNNENKVITRIKKQINLKNELYDDAERYLEILSDKRKFSWPNVFREIKYLRQFRKKYLKDIHNLVNVEVVLPIEYYNDFIDNEKYENNFEVSVYNFVEDGIVVEMNNKYQLGFDICGYSNNQFYSFICNGLQKEINEYGVKLNSYSLIDSYEDAKKIIELIDSKIIDAEEILWYPWLIIKSN